MKRSFTLFLLMVSGFAFGGEERVIREKSICDFHLTVPPPRSRELNEAEKLFHRFLAVTPSPRSHLEYAELNERLIHLTNERNNEWMNQPRISDLIEGKEVESCRQYLKERLVDMNVDEVDIWRTFLVIEFEYGISEGKEFSCNCKK